MKANTTPAALVAIDWADQKHDIAVLPAGVATPEHLQLEHRPQVGQTCRRSVKNFSKIVDGLPQVSRLAGIAVDTAASLAPRETPKSPPAKANELITRTLARW